MLIDKRNNGIIHEHKYEDIIEEGNQFLKGADILFWNWAKTNSPEPLTFPAFFCYAFSCELFLKGLSLKFNNSFKEVHKLITLFDDLPIAIQDKIKNDINTINFKDNLNSVNNIFEESRYFFDTDKFGKKNPNIDFIISFSKSLQKIANLEIIKKEIS